MKAALLLAGILVASACDNTSPAVLFNGPPELDGARVYVDGIHVGNLKAGHTYRWGVYAEPKEMRGPPRHEANLEIKSLRPGLHQLRIVAPRLPEFRGTFTSRGPHTEVFIPEEAFRRSRG
jgi:hypothetical protein